MPENQAAFVGVVFSLPLDETYWYANLAETPARLGLRVQAPLGRRSLIGYVIAASDTCPFDPEKMRSITRTVDREALFDEGTVELATWIARMYRCSPGEALGAMLPSGRRETPLPSSEIDDFEIGDRALELTDEQRLALDAVLVSETGTTYLYGSTGTGKTEVFLQAAERSMAAGKSVIYLVPEIALTAQVERAARTRFGKACAILHSRLGPSAKLAEWRRIMKGEATMVIGARSAIFAPVRELGLVVIDEEHEGSYKSGQTPRYHARQVAMYRAAREKARLILGSATPSVEAWHACESGAMERKILTRRPGGGAFPKIHVVDLKGEEGTISRPLRVALESTVKEGRQAILFLNRRGFSHFFSCATCGAELTCKNCSVSLTFHKETNQLVCHYCGYRSAPPKACPECGSLDVGWRGFGTERVEEELKELYPEMRIGRLDADSVSRKGVLESTLESFRTGELDVLVGTQMVAKGLNFPGVKTVGIILADAGLNLPDFRASERVFSLIVQVAGRAGRHDPDGQVYVQTLRPEHPVIRLAAGLSVGEFYRRELELREAMEFPPFTRLARIVARSKDRDACIGAARELGRNAAKARAREVEILGPAECPLSLVAGNHRWQILLRARAMASLRPALNSLLSGYKAPSSVYLEIDIDPVNLL